MTKTDQKLENYLKQEYATQLEHWRDLTQIAKEYLSAEQENLETGQKIARQMDYIRSSMAATKNFESALTTDIELCSISLELARRVFKGDKALINYVDACLYYSDFFPGTFNKAELEAEIDQLQSVST